MTTGDDPVLDALAEVVAAIEENERAGRQIVERARHIVEARAAGRGYADVVGEEERPLIVEMLRDTQQRLAVAGSRFRRTEAAALRAEGFTLDQIAATFGVTRQRVIALLADNREA